MHTSSERLRKRFAVKTTLMSHVYNEGFQEGSEYSGTPPASSASTSPAIVTLSHLLLLMPLLLLLLNEHNTIYGAPLSPISPSSRDLRTSGPKSLNHCDSRDSKYFKHQMLFSEGEQDVDSLTKQMTTTTGRLRERGHLYYLKIFRY
ncbi:hypothetical protein GQX74_006947 [Glossina fuscipes]|nr:hypothetical protein GQX74_006947 [Glossina fuscipes]